ncbi:MAG: MerR family transcriptional regulator [Bacilli bacterium]|nr:MerR family transcriptional regulator [Bacilli bacterium]
MYRIGEFSTLSKTTIKTLRYYEKEKLLIPSFVDEETSYRFYETMQLLELSKIVSLIQIGLSIDNIRNILNGADLKEVLSLRKKELEIEMSISEDQLSRINYLLEGRQMKYEVIVKELPEYVVYYKKGVIKDYSAITDFILGSAEECKKTNPNIKCIEPDYCYVSYLDEEYKERDITIMYAQAVTEMCVENETIKFKKLEPISAVCVYHKGAYDKLGDAYSFITKWIEDNNYEIIETPRERYIDGIWNKDNDEDWLTEIQFPVRKI